MCSRLCDRIGIDAEQRQQARRRGDATRSRNAVGIVSDCAGGAANDRSTGQRQPGVVPGV